ncbi:MAG TPA: thiamine pyrophosphate-dependent enzyme [Pirellulales bacterium]|nr:thiamine pyrophosphate-dependent enzyme [Pirellulales bacterium]
MTPETSTSVSSAPLSLDRGHGLELLRQMLLIRRFEEKSAELYTRGKIQGFLHLYIGEEAVAAGAIQALTSDDAVVSTYREHGGNPYLYFRRYSHDRHNLGPKYAGSEGRALSGTTP